MSDQPKSSDRDYMLFAARITGDFGATIAVPVVCLSLVGRWLDGRYGTGPLFLVIGFVVAAVISAATIYRKAKRYGREYEAIGKSAANPTDKKTKEDNAEDL